MKWSKVVPHQMMIHFKILMIHPSMSHLHNHQHTTSLLLLCRMKYVFIIHWLMVRTILLQSPVCLCWWCGMLGQPCSADGIYLPPNTPPPPRHTDHHSDDWTPYRDRIEFETAQFLYCQTQKCQQRILIYCLIFGRRHSWNITKHLLLLITRIYITQLTRHH